MNTLFLLHGAPGSGKSTFIRDHGLADITVSRDEMRRLVSGLRPCVSDLDGEFGMTMHSPWRVEKKITPIMNEVLASRMNLGQTIMVDGTHIDAAAQKPYVMLARDNGYDTVVIDFQSNVDAEELKRRNALRPVVDQVPEAVIDSFCTKAESGEHHRDVRVITPEEFESEITIEIIDYTGDKVVVIGDVQGMDATLDTLGTDANATYVFAGDLFDRGPDNVAVAERILSIDPARLVLVKGNHDEHAIRAILHGVDNVPRATRETFSQFADAGVDLQALLDVLLASVPMYAFSSAGREFIVTHGGVIDPGTRTELGWRTIYPDCYYVYGTGKHSATYQGRGDYGLDIDAMWENSQRAVDEAQRVHQLHGHRNSYEYAVDAFDHVTNLEHKVDSGGGLGVALIESGEMTRLVIPSK